MSIFHDKCVLLVETILLKEFIENNCMFSTDSINLFSDSYLILKDVFHSLEDKGLILERNIIIAKNSKGYFEVSDFNQIEKILQCGRKALNELNLDSLDDVIDIEKFKNVEQKYLHNELNFDYTFNALKIIRNGNIKYLKEELQENINKLKNENLSIEFINNLICQFEFDCKKIKNNLEYHKHYVDIQKLILTKLSIINEKSIDEFILNLQLY